MNNLIYCFGFIISLIIIFIGLYNTNEQTIQSGASLLFFMLMAFIGNIISEIRNKKIKLSIVKFMLPLFIVSAGIIIYGSHTNHIIIASFISFILGLSSFYFLFSKQKNE